MRRMLLSCFCLCVASAAIAQDKASPEKVSGIDQSLFSDSVKPGDNFYLYANDKWLDSTPIPEDKSNYGIFTVLNDETQVQVRALIENSAMQKAEPGTAAQKVGDLYGSVLDLEARNEAGLKPIAPLLESIAGIKTQTDLAKVLGELRAAGIGGPIVPYVSVDAKKSDQYTVYLTQSGLSLPDRDYYLEDEERYVKIREELKSYMADLLKAAGHKAAEKAADEIFAIENQIATLHWTKEDNRDPKATYNRRTQAEIDETLGAMKWYEYARAASIESAEAIVLRQPSFAEGLGKLFETVSIDQWKDYLTFHTIDGFASSLTQAMEKRHFDFHETAISGISEQEPLWKRGVNVTGSVLGELVGQLYVEKHFQPIAKKRMNELVDNLKRAFAQRIKSRDWMSEGTKRQALEKLSLFTTKIGYPDEWKDYDKLTIDGGVLADHLIAAAKFEYQRDLDKLGAPIDRNEWHMTPQTINAYYSPTMNEIVFPAAILQPPFFNLAAYDAVNYGGIGAVIGHELSHGFDDKGSQYDGKGNLRMWWTEEDRKEFERRAGSLATQYSEFEPVEGNFVNGEFTLGENIGDLGGLSVSYAAYQLSLDGKEAPVVDGLTGDQRFFLSWSQVWRRLYREPELLRRLVTDPHSPSEFRVNGIVRNMDAWYKAFGIKPESKLYLTPEERVRIW